MKVKLTGAALVLGLAMLPMASFAGGVGGGNANSNWTIYGWQNWALDFRSTDTASGSRDFTRMEGEAANLGFAANIDTGVSVAGAPVKATFQCEQFTFFNRLASFVYNNWCSRNSKLGLAGPWGEVMFSGWLTPYNEVTAQWVDPFYDAGSHTHSTLLGNVGWGVNYGNSGFDGTGYGAGVGGQGFMRRKDNMFQWFSPNWGGLQMRVGWSNNNRFAEGDNSVSPANASVVGHTPKYAVGDVVTSGTTPNLVFATAAEDFDPTNPVDGAGKALTQDQADELHDAIAARVMAEPAIDKATIPNIGLVNPVMSTTKLDPTMLSIGIAYTASIGDDELWLGFGYQEHDEFAAVDAGLSCADSNDETVRYAARYIKDWGNGHSTRLSLAYEEMEYDWEHCSGDGGAGPFDFSGTGGMVDFERDAWLISGKHNFPGPLDFRFMYMEADDFECGSSMTTMKAHPMAGTTVDSVDIPDGAMVVDTTCGGTNESSSGADAFSVGLYYTLPAGTELRMVYGEVDNDANSKNGFGISSAGVVAGGKEESFQFGMVQWF